MSLGILKVRVIRYPDVIEVTNSDFHWNQTSPNARAKVGRNPTPAPHFTAGCRLAWIGSQMRPLALRSYSLRPYFPSVISDYEWKRRRTSRFAVTEQSHQYV